MKYIGIDPGKQGCMAYVDGDEAVYSPKFQNMTEMDIWLTLAEWEDDGAVAVIEKVGATPQMGRSSCFTFGRGYGVLLASLTASGIAHVEVSPSKWQAALNCRTKKGSDVNNKGDKNITKRKAQQLYPHLQVTHINADALLLATYCRQNAADLF